jgi:peroxiredoxin
MRDFELPDQNGDTFRLAAELARGAVVLVFYRADW